MPRQPDSTTSPNDPRRNTSEEVARLHDMGWSVRRIAKSLDISTQRVYQILDARSLRDPRGAA